MFMQSRPADHHVMLVPTHVLADARRWANMGLTARILSAMFMPRRTRRLIGAFNLAHDSGYYRR